jgi:hypothetical protein
MSQYCDHNFKIIRKEEGEDRSCLQKLLNIRGYDVIVYHLQCSRCGRIISQFVPTCDKSLARSVWEATQ